MVRQDFDSKRLTALRTELGQQTAVLPAVLQSSDAVALVDHLTTVFNEADWKRTARCSGFVESTAPSEPSGWEVFQSVLRGEARPAEAQCDAHAMDTALLRLQADIHSIEQTTCLPPTKLAALTASSSGNHGHLQAVRCTVCHSLLLTAAFNDHLPRCRPCAPQSAVPSNSSHPSSSGRQASRPGSTRGRGASKKGKGRGSKKPPAGPSRFAMEQAKTPPQQQATARPPPHLQHHLPSHSSQQHQAQQHQHKQPPLFEATVPVVGLASGSKVPPGDMSASQVQAAGMSSSYAARQHSMAEEGEMGMEPQPRRAKRSRTAWTYEEHLCRDNPDLDAVHDPMLPPRFPQNVTRLRCRNRSHSDEPCQPRWESHPYTSTPGLTQLQHAAAGPPTGNALPLHNSKQAGIPQRGQECHLAPHKSEMKSTQSPRQQQPTYKHQQYINGLQGQSPPSSPWQQSSLAHSGTVSLSAPLPGQNRLLHDYPLSAPQLPDNRRRQPAQLPPSHQPAHSQQQDFQTIAAGYSRQQQPLLLQPAVQLPVGSFKVSAQHSMHGSASSHVKTYKQQTQAKASATNGLQDEGAAWPAANDSGCGGNPHFIELKASNGYRIPKSKKQNSVTALARSSLGT